VPLPVSWKMRIRTSNPGPNPRARRKPLQIPGTIAHDIGVQIVSGRYKPGDILHGEVETSDRLQVSRTAYREAVRILAAKGLVKAVRKAGTRVTPRQEWHLLDPDVLGWIFEHEPDEQLLTDLFELRRMVEPEEQLLENLFELRRMVEPEAAALAAVRRSESDLADMGQAIQGMARHGLTSEAGRKADQDFHAALLRSTGNAFFGSLVASVGAAVTWTTLYKGAHALKLRDSLPDHQRVYEAVAARDAGAARAAMIELIDLALRDTTAAQRGRKRRASAG